MNPTLPLAHLKRVLPDWTFTRTHDDKVACLPPGRRNAANFAALAVHAVIEEDIRGGWLVTELVPQVYDLTPEQTTVDNG